MQKTKFTLLVLVILSSFSYADDASSDGPKKKLTLQDLINNAAGTSQNSATVAGVRGLEETNGAVDTQARDFAALERLERLVIHDDELKKFVEEGGLQ
jgi:hypothetical protein